MTHHKTAPYPAQPLNFSAAFGAVIKLSPSRALGISMVFLLVSLTIKLARWLGAAHAAAGAALLSIFSEDAATAWIAFSSALAYGTDVVVGLLGWTVLFSVMAMGHRTIRAHLTGDDARFSWRVFGRVLLVGLVSTAAVWFGTMCCVLPGLAMLPVAAHALYLAATRTDLNAFECLREAARLTFDNLGRTLAIWLVLGLIGLVASVAVAAPMIISLFAASPIVTGVIVVVGLGVGVLYDALAYCLLGAHFVAAGRGEGMAV